MTKKTTSETQNNASVQNSILDHLDFTTTQKQVDLLMQSVLHETTLNENKIRFIKEQLQDQRYQISSKNIAHKMLEYPIPCAEELALELEQK